MVNEQTLKGKLPKQARSLLQQAEQDPSQTPQAIHDLLTIIIKPLFQTKHPRLTSTGRKTQFKDPQTNGRFNTESVFDESRPWKNGWTTDLLFDILSIHLPSITTPAIRLTAVEQNFHLTIPPILNLIDDSDLHYKVKGCRCLLSLCSTLQTTKSQIMKRTGLAEVFVDALKNNFIYLPTLTPEDESLELLENLYPAFLALVDVRFMDDTTVTGTAINLDRSQITSDQNKNKTLPSSPIKTESNDHTLRQSYLTLLLRHSLLYSLSHLSVDSSVTGSSTSPSISTFLISQIPTITKTMGPRSSTRFNQELFPLLRRVMSDPFAVSSAPELVLAATSAMNALIQQQILSKDGISVDDEEKENLPWRWTNECLRGIVACWLNVFDFLDVTHNNDDEEDDDKKRIRKELKSSVGLLLDHQSIDKQRGELRKTIEMLVAEEDDLRGLFE